MATEDSDPVTPRRYSPSDSPPPKPRRLPVKPSWLIAGGAIVLAVVWVIAIDRYAESDPELVRPEVAQPPPENRERAATPPSAVGPWESAEIAAQREETLALIQNLRDQKAALDGLSPQLWAKDELAEIAEMTGRGDAAYKDGDYASAQEVFKQALAATERQIDRASVVSQEAKTRGREALARGDLPDALEAFGIAAAIDPGDAEAAAGLTSASVRDEVDAMMVRGEFALKTGDFTGAEAQFKLAAQLDPADPRPREALARTGRLEKSDRTSRLTKQGFEAIEAGKFEQAIDRFSAALVLAPRSENAADGLKLAERRLLQSKLDTLQAKGSAAEERQDWQAAIASFEAALKLAPSKSFALTGLARARRYLALERDLDGYVSSPQRLTSNAVASKAQVLVAEVSEIPSAPPRLAEKSAKLQALLNDMSAVVDVTISSDGQSEITVQRMGNLGQFKQQTIGLKYGKYVLTARRIGYVDKRLVLEVPVGSQPLSVSLYCDERF